MWPKPNTGAKKPTLRANDFFNLVYCQAFHSCVIRGQYGENLIGKNNDFCEHDLVIFKSLINIK
jgi:hypothetical protein